MNDNLKGNMADGDEVILSTLHKRLEAFGSWKFGNKVYATESYQDCVQKIVVRVWQRRLWEQLPSEDDVYRYSCKALVNCIRDAWRRVKRTGLLLGDEVELISAPTSAVQDPSDVHRELELAAEEEWVISLFPDDDEMLAFLELLRMGKKRNEIARDMNKEPREVTDLWRKLKRTVKRHLKGRGHP